MQALAIENTSLSDLNFIFGLFDLSVDYQERKGFPVWRNYDKEALQKDIVSKNQYKVITESRIGIVFSVRYSDKVIWGEMDNGDAVYLHRIVVNPACKGQRLFGAILEWAIQHAKAKGLNYVRMDTWANNSTLVSYYESFGFKIVGNCTTPDAEELPIHNRNLELTLLALKVSEFV